MSLLLRPGRLPSAPLLRRLLSNEAASSRAMGIIKTHSIDGDSVERELLSARIPPEAFGSALWAAALRSDRSGYSRIVDVYSSLPPGSVYATDASRRALMLSYGRLRKPLKARAVAAGGVKPGHITAALLLDAYCKADKLEQAESLLFSWLQLHHGKSDNGLEELGKQLMLNRGTALSASKFGKFKVSESSGVESPSMSSPLADIGVADLLAHAPSAAAWQSVALMYSTRNAWFQCAVVTRYCESLYSSGSNNSRGVSIDDDPMTDFERLCEMYKATLRALCNAEEYAAALLLVSEFRAAHGTETSLSTLIDFVSIIVPPILNVLTDNTAAARVPNSALSPEAYLKETKDLLLLLLQKKGKAEGLEDRGLRSLSRNYVVSLCKSGLAEDADDLLERLYSSDALHDCIDALCMDKLVMALSEKRDWRAAEKWYHRLREAQGGSPDGMSYHHVCAAMRQAGEHQRMASFMALVSQT